MTRSRLSASGIYSITNTINGQQYIGSALNFSNRWKQHRFHLNRDTHHNQHLQRAWYRYGAKSFTFAVLEYVPDVAQLLVREQHYLDTLQPAYNECKIAGSAIGRPASEKQRAAMVEFNKRQVFTEERLTRMREITKARWQDPEQREIMSRRISEGQRTSKKHAEARRIVGERRRGRKMVLSDEERQRRRESANGLSALRWAKVRAARLAETTVSQPSLWD